MSWRDSAFILHNFEDPLEDVSGHFTSEEVAGGVALRFHPWDISREAYDERLEAGPAVMPSQHDFDMEVFRERGRQLRQQIEAKTLARFLENLADALTPSR